MTGARGLRGLWQGPRREPPSPAIFVLVFFFMVSFSFLFFVVCLFVCYAFLNNIGGIQCSNLLNTQHQACALHFEFIKCIKSDFWGWGLSVWPPFKCGRARERARALACAHANMGACRHTHMRACLPACLHACMHAYMPAHMYTCTDAI